MSEENYMRIIDLRGKKLTRAEMLEAMPRAEMGTNEATELVQPILDDVKARGAAALRDFAEKFDHIRPEHLRVPVEAMKAAVDQAVFALDAGQQPAIVTRRPCLLIKRDKFRKGMCHVNADKCRGCRSCLRVGCPAISMENGKAVIDRTQCVGCTVCAQVCPFDAIEKEEN